MNEILEGKRLSLNRKKRKLRKKAMNKFCIFIIIVLGIYLVDYWLKLSSLPEPFWIAPIIFGVSLFLVIYIYTPLDYSEDAYLHLVSSVESLENSIGDPDLVDDAYEQLLKAIKALESMQRGEASYYYNTRLEEKTLIRNLKNRVAPAILTGGVTHINLQEIAQIFTNSDTALMKRTNAQLEKMFEPGESSDEPERSIFSSLLESTFGKLVVSFVSGFGIVLTFAWIASILSVEFAQQVKGNLFGLFGFCIILTVGFMSRSSKT